VTEHSALVEPGPLLSPEQLIRYSRQLALPGFGELAQRRLANARVLVVGAGGLGSATIPALAAAGVGTIGVVDTDAVELSNLHRQLAHGLADIGRSKLASIADAVAGIDPAVVVVLHDEWLDSSTVMDVLAGYDLVLDGSDNFPTRYLVNDAAALSRTPLVWGAILGFGGQAGVAWAEHGPTYRDLFPVPPAPGTVPSCTEGGVLPTVCAAIGAIMATEAIKLITGIGEPLIGRVTTYDALSGRYRELEYAAADDAAPITGLIDYEAFCGVATARREASAASRDTIGAIELAALLVSGDPVQLVDVREPFEWEIARIEGAELVPLGGLGDSLAGIRTDVPVVLYCHHGNRSARALTALRSAGFANARHLAGGIDDYAARVDPALARY
jgi:adenylyltransferase/sulfurtransferase